MSVLPSILTVFLEKRPQARAEYILRIRLETRFCCYAIFWLNKPTGQVNKYCYLNYLLIGTCITDSEEHTYKLTCKRKDNMDISLDKWLLRVCFEICYLIRIPTVDPESSDLCHCKKDMEAEAMTLATHRIFKKMPSLFHLHVSDARLDIYICPLCFCLVTGNARKLISRKLFFT